MSFKNVINFILHVPITIFMLLFFLDCERTRYVTVVLSSSEVSRLISQVILVYSAACLTDVFYNPKVIWH